MSRLDKDHLRDDGSKEDPKHIPFKRGHQLPVKKPSDHTPASDDSLKASPSLSLLSDEQGKWILTVIRTDSDFLDIFVLISNLGPEAAERIIEALRTDEQAGITFLHTLKKQDQNTRSIMLEKLLTAKNKSELAESLKKTDQQTETLTGKTPTELQTTQREGVTKIIESGENRSTRPGSSRVAKPGSGRINKLSSEPDALEIGRQMLLKSIGGVTQEQIEGIIEAARGVTPIPPEKNEKRKKRVLDAILIGDLKPETLKITNYATTAQCKSIFTLYHEQLSYRKKRDRLTSRKVDVKDFYGGWIVFIPQSEQVVQKRAPFTMVIPDPTDKTRVICFVDFSWIGHGITAQELQHRFEQMEKDSIQTSHKSIILNKFSQGKELHRVAWIEMSASDQIRQKNLDMEGGPELLEMMKIYEIFTQHPEIDHIFSEILGYPDVNLGSMVSHRMRFGIEVVAKRIEKTPKGRFDWLIVDHPLFREMIKRYPERALTFQEFVTAWRSLLPKITS